MEQAYHALARWFLAYPVDKRAACFQVGERGGCGSRSFVLLENWECVDRPYQKEVCSGRGLSQHGWFDEEG